LAARGSISKLRRSVGISGVTRVSTQQASGGCISAIKHEKIIIGGASRVVHRGPSINGASASHASAHRRIKSSGAFL